ncbi:MarR family winged helix-turn-helix transcriptional regulator [Rhodovulum euryhalinum]|uniref:DNA-binding MarR family transcriptional regulator n=1 Tax=Rhodovulum euryhalinum TaxID=35805 RepID=A0A4R2KIR0_9RHOB|nr:MarR family transcriptional regulator [Rhodovulum euryhalinum]TCO73094.1 DNA-binding MarR family transcriptional regulator [Rhodovulum euryhalinum]
MIDPAMRDHLPQSVAHAVGERCLCLHVQRAARVLARRFDRALRPFGLTSGQFSLMMALNRPVPPLIGDLAPFLGMDRTTLTAALKPLERRGLVAAAADAQDRRGRRLRLTETGADLLARALPAWRAAHDALDADLPDQAGLRAGLLRIAATG